MNFRFGMCYLISGAMLVSVWNQWRWQNSSATWWAPGGFGQQYSYLLCPGEGSHPSGCWEAQEHSGGKKLFDRNSSVSLCFSLSSSSRFISWYIYISYRYCILVICCNDSCMLIRLITVIWHFIYSNTALHCIIAFGICFYSLRTVFFHHFLEHQSQLTFWIPKMEVWLRWCFLFNIVSSRWFLKLPAIHW